MAFGTLRRIALSLLAAPLLAAAAPPRIDSIEMETSSWGDPVTGWRISSDGTGEYRHRRAVEGNPREADLVTNRFQAGREGFARIVAILRPILGRQQIMCREKQIYDLPYGHIGRRDSRTPWASISAAPTPARGARTKPSIVRSA